MIGSQPRLRVEREWPWALAVLADPHAQDQLPGLNEAGVAACRSAVAVGIRHAIDGLACAELWLGAAPVHLVCIHAGTFWTDSGDVAISDAGVEQSARATVASGQKRLRVLVDEVQYPARVVFELTGEGE